jgi:hypothetical protein
MFAPLRFYMASKLSFQNSELFKSSQPSERRVASQHLSAYARSNARSARQKTEFGRALFTEANMNAPYEFCGLTLHVFEQDGGWNWGLTIERLRGTGEKVVAYSDPPFLSEAQAREDGGRAYDAARFDVEGV